MVNTGIGQIGPKGYDPYLTGLKAVAKNAGASLKNAGTNAKNAVSNAVSSALSKVSGAAASAKQYLSNAGQTLADFGKSAYDSIFGSGFSSGSGYGSAGSASGLQPSGFTVKDGKVQFADPNLQYTMQMINQQAAANNAWSAEQAQKQMDFQKMMSDTAHQREVADLQAAGLNPVLSSGGNGAQVTSGAMAEVDDSNTRLIADLAMSALDAMSNTAVGVASAAGGSSSKGLLDNYYVRKALTGFSSGAGRQLAVSLVKRMF